MKINWKARFKNKTFVITFLTLVIAFVYQALGLFGVVPPIAEESIVNVLTIGVNFLAVLGVVVDPTTDGINDSDRALTYETSVDVRVLESNTPQIDSYTKQTENYPVEAHPVSDNENDKATASAERKEE